MKALSFIIITLTFQQLVSSEPFILENLSTELPFEYNADNLHLLNDAQLQALLSLHENPEYHEIPIDPEAFMTMEEIVQYHGYPIKSYTVQTEDGYILTIHRIPHGKSGPGTKPRKPVLIQHGILCSSASWVTNVPDKNLPYLVADDGYDVWLGNVRGTLFGYNHTKLSPKDNQFWKYSFDEMAQYDIPVIIDLILAETGFKQIHYIAHSMGTTMMWALLSTQPKYNDIVRGVYALAPVARLKHVKSPLRLLAPFTNQIKWMLSLLGTGQLMPNGGLIQFLSQTVCTSALKFVCSNILFIACGYNPEQLNMTRLPVHLHHTPAATSSQTIIHFGQLARSGNFQKYDHGERMNMQIYGTMRPPKYDLKNIKTKVALFWSENDYLASSKDVAWLAPQLENLVLKHKVVDPKFSHMDFIWAIDVRPLLYDKVLATIKKMWKN